MNRLIQKTGLLLVVACLSGTVFGGLLPSGGGGGNGYQYNRPSGGTGGFGGNGFGGNVRPSASYGAPGFGGGFGGQGISGGGFTGGFGGPGTNGGGFGGRPSTNYGSPGFGGNGGFQGGNGGGYQGGSGGNGGYNYNDDNGRPRPYSFQYEVRDAQSGNDYGQQESSDGNTVRGEYRVLLPDSRTQIVRYTADDANGYNADVQYEGQAQFPQGGGGYNQGVGNYQGGFPGNGGGYRGGAVGGGGTGSGSGSGFGSSGNQYLPPGVDYGK